MKKTIILGVVLGVLFTTGCTKQDNHEVVENTYAEQVNDKLENVFDKEYYENLKDCYEAMLGECEDLRNDDDFMADYALVLAMCEA